MIDSAAARLLGIGGGDAGAEVHARIDLLRRLVLVYGSARSWLWVALAPEGLPVLLAAAVVATASAALAFVPRTAALAPRLALPALAAQLWWTLPFTNNHFFLELVVVALLALVGRERDGERTALAAIRWVTALVLFHTGLQKVLYGLYFRGEFLAFMTAQADRFADLFRWLLPADELERLVSLATTAPGAGPFRTTALPFVAASNLVWIAEIALGLLLLPRATRAAAATGALVLVLVLQLAAREAGFAILFAALLGTSLPRSATRALLPCLLALLAWAVAAGFGWLPGRSVLEGFNP